jgi:hypothetical protein
MKTRRKTAAAGPGRVRMPAAAVLLVLAVGSCQMFPVITVKDKVDGAQPRGRVAVVCGQRTRHCALLAERITRKLSAAAVSVLSQEEITARLEVYPSNLSADSWFTEKEAADLTLSEAHGEISSRLGEKLGVDYVLLVWFQDYFQYQISHTRYDGKTFSSYHSTHYFIAIRGRILGLAGTKVTGAVDYSIDTPFSMLTARHTEFLDRVIDKAAGSIVKRILKAWQ